jgi:hypothetical protein
VRLECEGECTAAAAGVGGWGLGFFREGGGAARRGDGVGRAQPLLHSIFVPGTNSSVELL